MRLALLGAVAMMGFLAPAHAGEAAAKPEVVKSTVVPSKIGDIYTADRLRDPFSPIGASSGGSNFKHKYFNIHNLELSAIMKDGETTYALLVDQVYSVSFILRKGRLYDSKSKRVRGITGIIDIRKKTVKLVAPDQDVQVYRLGEEAEI